MKSAKISYFAAQLYVLNPSFDIRADQENFEHATLFVEIGQSGITALVLNDDSSFSHLVNYQFRDTDDDHSIALALKKIFETDPLMGKVFRKTEIIWSFEQTVLVPPAFYKQDHQQAMLELIYGEIGEKDVRTEFLFRHNLHNVYQVPAEIAHVIRLQFPLATHCHQFSVMPEISGLKGDHATVLFSPGRFSMALIKEGKLQMIRGFAYSVPEDAAYRILMACRSFKVDPLTLPLVLCGMIDTDSHLYKELYKYFLRIELLQRPGQFSYPDKLSNEPQQFFSHLFATAACAS